MEDLVSTFLSAGKWLLLLPFRLIVAVLNIIPTWATTYTTIHRSQFGQITNSFNVEALNPVHLGHFLVAWIRGRYGRVSLVELESIDQADVRPARQYLAWAVAVENLDKIQEECKIW